MSEIDSNQMQTKTNLRYGHYLNIHILHHAIYTLESVISVKKNRRQNLELSISRLGVGYFVFRPTGSGSGQFHIENELTPISKALF